jgi:hypothetical protein
VGGLEGGNRMKLENRRKKIAAALLSMILIASLYIPSIFSQAIIGVNVNIKPVLMLEVFTPSQIFRSAGQTGVLLITPLNIEENPIHIRVRLVIPKGQIVQLRVEVNGDLINSKGEIFPISNVGWHAKGPGFQNGILNKNSPQIIATWTKSGFYEGIINYYWVKPPSLPQDFTQLITYTLVSL